jgi:hypothetical protein
MSRLNEAPAPPESHLEIRASTHRPLLQLPAPVVNADCLSPTVRRKFLRQNRDIAKINSDQSQKIRRLENDCARLLSENLDLRGQILRLEKQIEDNSARRIADHALEVKAKLEVQLSEFTALLGSLGVEPPAKRRSSGDRILLKSRQSMARSPPQRRRRGTSIDSEALAEMEGRLPPIYENKTYPRATMRYVAFFYLTRRAYPNAPTAARKSWLSVLPPRTLTTPPTWGHRPFRNLSRKSP